jgi:hypothetical protein
MSAQPERLKKTEDRRTYMREYMRKRYIEKKDECKAYGNSVKCKNNHNLSSDDLKEYGMFLADIYKLRKIKAKLPVELFEKIINDETTYEAI